MHGKAKLTKSKFNKEMKFEAYQIGGCPGLLLLDSFGDGNDRGSTVSIGVIGLGSERRGSELAGGSQKRWGLCQQQRRG